MFIPVVDHNQHPLMPTTPSRARRWIRDGKATGFWKRGVFCVRLNVEPAARHTQPVAVGLDPGSKREGLVVASAAHTYLNVQASAVDWVKEAVATRRIMRRSRRGRKTPHRANRRNRARGGIPPSTRARWGWKLRLAKWLAQMYPIAVFVVEDVAATTKPGKHHWNRAFSPLAVGKRWFYTALQNIAPVSTRQGYETAQYRDGWGLPKTKDKLAERWDAHCVDAWVLAQSNVRGVTRPDNIAMLIITPLRFHRRQLHALQPAKGGVRRPYGGTRSCGFKRGSYVQHPKWGLCYVGGTLNGRISLHALRDGKRRTQNARPTEVKFRTFASWRARPAAPPAG